MAELTPEQKKAAAEKQAEENKRLQAEAEKAEAEKVAAKKAEAEAQAKFAADLEEAKRKYKPHVQATPQQIRNVSLGLRPDGKERKEVK